MLSLRKMGTHIKNKAEIFTSRFARGEWGTVSIMLQEFQVVIDNNLLNSLNDKIKATAKELIKAGHCVGKVL